MRPCTEGSQGGSWEESQPCQKSRGAAGRQKVALEVPSALPCERLLSGASQSELMDRV